MVEKCEKAADELRVLRVEVAGLREQIKMRDELIALKDQRLADALERGAFWKAAATERKAALGVDDRIAIIQETQLTECKGEMHRLKNPGLLQRLFKPDTLTAGVVGFGLGRFGK